MISTLLGSPPDIIAKVRAIAPGLDDALRSARAIVPHGGKEVYQYQAAVLYALAQQYNKPGAEILEIGTYYGYTAAIMAIAAPKAHITTLNVLEWEVKDAADRLRVLRNITVKQADSHEYVDVCRDGLAMVFVDGDHKRVQFDFPYWNKLATTGTIIFHDYSPEGTPRACVPVYNNINNLADYLGRAPDILVVDDTGVGMAGWRKRDGDVLYSQ